MIGYRCINGTGRLRPDQGAQTGLRNTIWYVFRNLLLKNNSKHECNSQLHFVGGISYENCFWDKP